MKIKKLVALGTVIAVTALSSINVFAASNYNSVAEIVAGLTGRTLQSVLQEKINTGKTYGTIASEADVLEEFKAENLELKKDIIEDKVAKGQLTREEADRIIKTIEDNQANCTGTGTGSYCLCMGTNFGGLGQGGGQGQALGKGQSGKAQGIGKGQGGTGKGQGIGGMKLQDGSCYQ